MPEYGLGRSSKFCPTDPLVEYVIIITKTLLIALDVGAVILFPSFYFLFRIFKASVPSRWWRKQ